YALKNCSPSWRCSAPLPQRRSNSSLQASPATISFRTLLSSLHCPTTSSTVGGNIATLMLSCSSHAAISAPGSNRSRPARLTRPPAISPRHSSKIDASKLRDENCNTCSPASTPKLLHCASARLRKPLCVTCTPLGTPVDPDV